jgi:hypothetical protein
VSEEKLMLPNRMSLGPGLNLALIIQCSSGNNFYFFYFTYPVRCLGVAEDHWSRHSGTVTGEDRQQGDFISLLVIREVCLKLDFRDENSKIPHQQPPP